MSNFNKDLEETQPAVPPFHPPKPLRKLRREEVLQHQKGEALKKSTPIALWNINGSAPITMVQSFGSRKNEVTLPSTPIILDRSRLSALVEKLNQTGRKDLIIKVPNVNAVTGSTKSFRFYSLDLRSIDLDGNKVNANDLGFDFDKKNKDRIVDANIEDIFVQQQAPASSD